MSAAEKLEQAQSAYHAVATGEQVLEVSDDNGTVKYSSVNIDALSRYIEALRIEVSAGLSAPRRNRKIIRTKINRDL